VKEIVDTETKALGVYMVIIYILVSDYESRRVGAISFLTESSITSVIEEDELRLLFADYFAGKGEEVGVALEAAKAFVNGLVKYENIDKISNVLGEIEIEIFNELKKSIKKHLRLDLIDGDLREKVHRILLDVSNGFYGYALTPARTCALALDELKKELWLRYGIGEVGANSLVERLAASKLAMRVKQYLVFPAPCLTDEILRLVAKPVSETGMLFLRPPHPERFRVKPSREVLEGIVASVLEDLGFRVSTNVSKEARRGSPVEVDVWAERVVAGTRFSVYVSCRNWDKAIDRTVIDEERGRVINLRDWPQLKIFIAKELTKPAREAAEADGFLVIELGEKAEAENAEEIYKLVYRTLNELFVSIAPPKLREIVAKIEEVRESLKKIEEELSVLIQF
jgi:hypothetical protein